MPAGGLELLVLLMDLTARAGLFCVFAAWWFGCPSRTQHARVYAPQRPAGMELVVVHQIVAGSSSSSSKRRRRALLLLHGYRFLGRAQHAPERQRKPSIRPTHARACMHACVQILSLRRTEGSWTCDRTIASSIR